MMLLTKTTAPTTGSTCKFQLLLVFVVVLLVKDFALLHETSIASLSIQASTDSEQQHQARSSNDRTICPHAKTLFGNMTTLEEAIAAAKSFHLDGGNLKALQEYLDGQVQPTYEHHDLKFLPKSTPTEAQTNVVPYLKDHYEKEKHLYAARGGYGQDLPGAFQDAEKKSAVLMGGRWIDVREPVTQARWEVSMGPAGPNCTSVSSYGRGYEKKHLCDVPVDGECHILSIGSNDQWGFERGVLSKTPHCHTHTFDCTLPGKPKRKPNHPNVHFYPYCISTKAEVKNGRQYLTYTQMWNETGVQSAPKALKMDIEGFEYDVWANTILTSPSTLWPEQVIMELHYATRMVDLPWMLRMRQAGEFSLFFALMFQKGGYVPVYQFWQLWPTLVEVLMVRMLCSN
jgi:hypothetical protein